MIIKRKAKRAEIKKNISPHSFRRSLVTNLYQSRRLEILDAAPNLMILAGLPSNHFEKLKGKRAGANTVFAINKQYRLCFE